LCRGFSCHGIEKINQSCKGVNMRTTMLLLGTLIAASSFMTTAEAQNYPWCAYYGRGGARNCGFETFQQCQADVLGIGGSCQRNTMYQPQKTRRPN
jgi:Protein of unknown function (DUF3551)